MDEENNDLVMSELSQMIKEGVGDISNDVLPCSSTSVCSEGSEVILSDDEFFTDDHQLFEALSTSQVFIHIKTCTMHHFIRDTSGKDCLYICSLYAHHNIKTNLCINYNKYKQVISKSIMIHVESTEVATEVSEFHF